MAQQLRALTSLAEDPGSVPGTRMVVHSHLDLQFQGVQSSKDSRHKRGTKPYTQAKRPYT